MQHNNSKTLHFRKAVGAVFKKLRIGKTGKSISKFAREFDIDRGNLSRIERGDLGCGLIMSWLISEACNVDFSTFAKLLEKELGEDFKLIDE